MAKCKWKPPEDDAAFYGDQACNRSAEEGSKDGLCIFHIPLEEKNQNPGLAERLRKEIFNLYQAGEYDFMGFEFPDGFEFGKRERNYLQPYKFIRPKESGERGTNREDESRVNFCYAKFGNGVKFTDVKFEKEVSFRKSIFTGQCFFRKTKFIKLADFREVKFIEKADFKETEFAEQSGFRNAEFIRLAYFSETKFGGNAEFENSKFYKEAFFGKSEFSGKAIFKKSIFIDMANFWYAIFNSTAYFNEIKFNGAAYFKDAKFNGPAYFIKTFFKNNGVFDSAEFEKEVDFSRAEGGEHAYSVEGILDFANKVNDKTDKESLTEYKAEYYRSMPPELIFKKTCFDRTAIFQYINLDRTIFQLVNLKNLSFLNSQISRTKFISCKWGEGGENRKYINRKRIPSYRFKRPRLLYDELNWRKIAPPKKTFIQWLAYIISSVWRLLKYLPTGKQKEVVDRVNTDPSPGDIQVLALQLKQSLEATKDPIAAGDFHFAAMEMKQWMAKDDGRWARARALWLYKMVNGYCERYGRTMMWIVLLIAMSTIVYWQFCEFVPAGRECDAAKVTSFLDFLMYACQNVLPLKFTQMYIKPCCQLGRFLSLFETFLGTTLFTFMVLALRRRFKR